MKKKSIMAKMLQAFLLVCLVSLAASGATALISLLKVRTLTLQSSQNIGSTAAGSGNESLRDQALRDITELVKAKSDLIDFQLKEAQDMVLLLKGYIERIYRGKEFTEDDLIRSGLLEEIYLLGNPERANRLIMKNMPAISTIYLTTESGQNIQYDGNIALKAAFSALPELRNRPWYRAARDRNGTYISDAGRGSAGRRLVISISTPFSNRGGEFAGVVGIDIKIEDLDENIRKTVVAKSGYAVLLNTGAGEDGKGTEIVSAPGLNEQNQNDMAAFLGNNADRILAEMKSQPSGSG
ncbi:MAG: hypothetical protein LBB83_05160, partial [Treponema sp.]|nr:hypothetical protein [Treponema sp.]